jgi:cytidyltransferase-like protein
MDGVFDLFHVGHVHAIQQCAQLGDTVIIGMVSDTDATSYKRAPIISQQDRIAVVESIKCVHQVICPCPLIVTLDFIQQYNIDLVVHGFANTNDLQKQLEFFRIPQEMNIFQQIDYYDKLSTTDIIQKILAQRATGHNDDTSADIQLNHDNNKSDIPTTTSNDVSTSKRFGTVLAAATTNSSTIPYDPFPLSLRMIIDPHIQKARTKQNTAIDQVCKESNMTKTQVLRMIHNSSPLATEGIFNIDTQRYPLRETLLQCGGFPSNFDLTQLHEQYDNKDSLLEALTCNFVPFQSIYDDFVRNICIPRMVQQCHNIDVSSNPIIAKETCCYYQAFPCIRIVQPNEFSIGPHSDITYGHHIGCINIYVPLTCIDGTAALFLESRYGSEDWHPIVGNYGMVQHFPGATCLHWTTNNTSNYTRVSLDFRLISGSIHDAFPHSGNSYRDGFYNCCHFRQETGIWERTNTNIISPDKRTGFPWTVKDWNAYRRKKQQD